MQALDNTTRTNSRPETEVHYPIVDVTSDPTGMDGMIAPLPWQAASQEIVHENGKISDSAICMETLTRGLPTEEPKLAISSNEIGRGPSASGWTLDQAQEEDVWAVNLASNMNPMDLAGLI